MTQRRGFTALILSGILCLAVASCSGRPRVYPAQGAVTSGALPAAGAVVVLHPLDEQATKGLLPHGRAESDGSFVISTYREGDGAPAGEYALTVVWPRLVQQEGEVVEGEDRLNGQFNSVEAPYMKVTITEGSNRLPPIELPSR